MPDTWVVVLEIPNCDLCGPVKPIKAYADSKLRGIRLRKGPGIVVRAT